MGKINVKAKQQYLAMLKKDMFVLNTEATYSTIPADEVIREVSKKLQMPEIQIRSAFSAIPEIVESHVCNGHSVEIPYVGHLRFGFSSSAVEKAEDVKKQLIKSYRLNYQPSTRLKRLLRETAIAITIYDKQGNIIGSTTDSGSDVDENAGGDENGTGEGNQNGGGNQQTGGNVTPSEVTYTFKYHDDTEDSRVGLPGAAVDAPEPDEGYNWNTVVPTVFGNSNRTFTEVAVAQGGGAETYTATLHIGSSYVTRTGEAGSVIDLPELQSGYTWPSNMPTVMPAQDFTAYAIEGEQDMTEYTLTVQHNGETIRTEQLHADDIVFLGTAPAGYKWTNTPRYSKMPARNWTISTAAV